MSFFRFFQVPEHTLTEEENSIYNTISMGRASPVAVQLIILAIETRRIPLLNPTLLLTRQQRRQYLEGHHRRR